MIAFAASLRFSAGQRSEVSEEIDPNLALVRHTKLDLDQSRLISSSPPK
jgi:hypothetical protein